MKTDPIYTFITNKAQSPNIYGDTFLKNQFGTKLTRMACKFIPNYVVICGLLHLYSLLSE